MLNRMPIDTQELAIREGRRLDRLTREMIDENKNNPTKTYKWKQMHPIMKLIASTPHDELMPTLLGLQEKHDSNSFRYVKPPNSPGSDEGAGRGREPGNAPHEEDPQGKAVRHEHKICPVGESPGIDVPDHVVPRSGRWSLSSVFWSSSCMQVCGGGVTRGVTASPPLALTRPALISQLITQYR